MCIREMQDLGLLNRTQHRRPSQSVPPPMPCIIVALKDTKMDPPWLYPGWKVDPTPTALITHTHVKRSCLVRHPSGLLELDLRPF